MCVPQFVDPEVREELEQEGAPVADPMTGDPERVECAQHAVVHEVFCVGQTAPDPRTESKPPMSCHGIWLVD